MDKNHIAGFIAVLFTLLVAISYGNPPAEVPEWQTVLRSKLAEAPRNYDSYMVGQDLHFSLSEAVGEILETQSSVEVLAFLRVLGSEPVSTEPKALIRARILHDWTLVVTRHLHGMRMMRSWRDEHHVVFFYWTKRDDI